MNKFFAIINILVLNQALWKMPNLKNIDFIVGHGMKQWQIIRCIIVSVWTQFLPLPSPLHPLAPSHRQDALYPERYDESVGQHYPLYRRSKQTSQQIETNSRKIFQTITCSVGVQEEKVKYWLITFKIWTHGPTYSLLQLDKTVLSTKKKKNEHII